MPNFSIALLVVPPLTPVAVVVLIWILDKAQFAWLKHGWMLSLTAGLAMVSLLLALLFELYLVPLYGYRLIMYPELRTQQNGIAWGFAALFVLICVGIHLNEVRLGKR